MNILFFSRLFYPHIGGVEKHVLEVSKILMQQGHKITVITEQHEKKIKIKEEFEGIIIHRIPNLKEGWFKKIEIWKWLWRNRQLIGSVDVIHCHDVFFWYLPFRFLYPKKPVYTTFHGYEANDLPSKKAIFMHKLAEKLSWGNICVGDYLKKWYGTKPNYVTYGGVDLKKVQSTTLRQGSGQESKVQSYSSKFKIVFVGRLEEETGIIEYLKAVKILKDKGYSIKLTVLGDGAQRLQAEQFCNSNKLDVDFRGFVNNVFDYLVDADFVFTSRYLSTLESLFARKFVFSVYNNPIKKDCFEMSPFANFISLAKDEINLASRFIYCLNNKDFIYNKVQSGQEWVKRQTWEKLEKLYLDLWRSNE